MIKHRFKFLVGFVMLLMVISLYFWMTQERPILPVIKQAPDFKLLDVNGNPFQFHETDSKVRLVEFLFTSCPDICPMTTYNMVQIQNELKKQQLWGNKVQFLSITFDPEQDTPEVFKAYGDRMGMDYSGWTLLTGTETETADVAKSFGVMVQKLPDNTFVHSVTSLMLVDPTGKIRKIFKMGDEMNNDEIIKMIRQAAGS
ncbi:SCO family protein [Paenibacillus sp. OAS669]|uniref:SCO family protein n=1 Tax=Paenibacillus sp. OAS669 TaxID=2663821 RepID=UPI001789CA68|nr:SCO family protein [Paenibacillus sp. OAS669]MBE1445778.1 protein SCO1/2 [Paenibacillus sp. OAS669]